MIIYLVIFLGSCSPIHCRLLVMVSGILCIILSTFAGNYIGFKLGYLMNDTHYAMPFLTLGIGVDDIFVICNAFDQTPLDLPASERIKRAMRNSGPSITITSLTNSFAFLVGVSSTVEVI